MNRIILLADMNSFFASCHQAIQPELKDEKVIVAGDPQRRTGIVLAASYPAKYLGVKTGMPLWEAKQLCPDGYFFKPDYRLYVDLSSRILRVMRDITDMVEPFSIDEAFADITGVIDLWGPPNDTANMLKERILNEIGVMCSIGIGPNKLIAKMAAGVEKPNGLTILEDVDAFKRVFWPMPVRKLFGVGSRYEKHLRDYNVHTIGDLARFPVKYLKKRWGKNGELLWHLANGTDHSPVVPTSLDTCKSIGQQKTLPRDLQGLKKIKIVMLELCETIARRVRQGDYIGRTVSLTLRDPQLRFFSRSQSMSQYTDLADEIYYTACNILEKYWEEAWPVRLVGLSFSNLTKKDHFQYDIFGERMRFSQIARACDGIKDRFGESAVMRGISLTEGSIGHGK
ncbi:MAG: DNA polymerase IV [Firmicutes bacterium]|nr:DNA polymerase IV [Bacillota bacterium]